MDKLKNVLNPGHKEQDDLLYDTGNSKKAGEKATESSNVTTSGASITSDPKVTSTTTGASGTGHSSAEQSYPIDTTTSRTAVNQKEHMAPQDFAAASTPAQPSTGQTHPSTQPLTGPASTTSHGHDTTRDATLSHNNTTTGAPYGQNTTTTGAPYGQTTATDTTHGHHTGRDAAIGAGAVGAAGAAHHEHEKHKDATDESKKEPNIIKKIFSSSKDKEDKHVEEHHHHHTSDHKRDTAVGAGTVGAAGAAHHEHEKHKDHTDEAKKEPNIIQKIFSSSKDKDEKPVEEHHSSKERDHRKDAAIGAGAIGAAGTAHHQHDKHHEPIDESKKEPNIIKKIFGSSKDKDEKHLEEHHSTAPIENKEKKDHNIIGGVFHSSDKKEKEASHDATTTGHVRDGKLHKDPKHHDEKEGGIIASILHPGGKKHDESSHATASSAPVDRSHQTVPPQSGHATVGSTAPTNQSPANASIGGAQTAAPIGAGAVGAVFAAHEVKKHDAHAHTQQTHGTSGQHSTVAPFDLSRSSAPAGQAAGQQQFQTPVGQAAGHQSLHSGTSGTQHTSHRHEAGTASALAGAGIAGAAVGAHEHKSHSHTTPSQQSHGAGTTSGIASTGVAGAAIGAHEHHSHSQTNPTQQSQGGLTHHQHNTGTMLSHGQTTGHEHQHPHHDHSHDLAKAAAIDSATHNDSPPTTGHEQRDLHQHGADSGLSHHVHNGVTPLPHRSHNSHDHTEPKSIQRDTVGLHSDTTGPAAGLGASSAGVAAAAAASKSESHGTAQPSTTSTSDSGPASNTKGPHSSNILNILDPRVRPDVKAIQAEKEAKKNAETNPIGSSSIPQDNKSSIPSTVAHATSGPSSSTTGPSLSNTGPSSSTTGPRSSTTGPSSSTFTARDSKTPSYSATAQDSTGVKSSHAPQSNVSGITSAGATSGSTGQTTQSGADSTVDRDIRAAAITSEARGGAAKPDVATISADKQATAETIAAENSGAAGTHHDPAHTDNVKGIVTGERGNTGDSSNVYSRKPLDDRVNMPGSYPESTTNLK